MCGSKRSPSGPRTRFRPPKSPSSSRWTSPPRAAPGPSTRWPTPWAHCPTGSPTRCWAAKPPGATRCGAGLAIADPDDRRHAAFSVGRITAADAGRRPPGYARWLAGARELFAVCELPVRHLVLITDGSGRGDEDEAYREDSALRTELARCEGEFTADVIALGESWDPAALLAVAERLHGDAAYAPEAFAPAVDAAVVRLRRIRSPALALTVAVRPAVREVTLTETAPRQQRLEPAA